MSQTTSNIRSFGFFLNGDWNTHGREAVVTSPYDHSVLAVISEAGSDDVEVAIESAVQAFAVTRKMTSQQRADVLHKIVEGITSRREEFARTICQEAGKPIRTAHVEVERAIYTFQLAAEESTRIYGEYIPLDTLESAAGRWGLVRRFPLGPVFGITPFNFPLNLVAHKVAPAIAAGCPIILKPAPQTPISSFLLAEVVQEAGWPEGALAVMPLSNEDAGILVADDRIKLLTFTGSAAVGWQLKNQAGKKRVTLELGGNAGVIVHSDADLQYCRPALRRRRLFLWRANLHFRAANPGTRIAVREVHRATGARRSQTEIRRSHAGDNGRASAHSRAGRNARDRMD